MLIAKLTMSAPATALLLVVGASGVTAGRAMAGPPPAVPPLEFKAVSDAKVYPKPPLPKLGPAGTVFKDPTFGCPILRVTDENTLDGNAIVTPPRADENPWNTDSTLFCVLNIPQFNIPFRFDPRTMRASRLPETPILTDMQGAVAFSRTEPNVCYGKNRQRGTIVRHDFATGESTDLVDIARLTGLEVGYLGTLNVSGNEVLALVFGGAMQDASPYMLVYNVKTGKHRLWNTKDGTLDGKPARGAPSFTQHTGGIDLSGRYVWALGRGVSGPIIWDTRTDAIYPMLADRSGHQAGGYGTMVNDVHRWILRGLDPQGIDHPTNLMQHPPGEGYFGYDSHVSWNNARPEAKVPVVLSTYHAEEQGDPHCAYGDEVLAVATDGSQRMWRFAHHRSVMHRSTQDRSARGWNFWDTPRGNVAQDGRFYMFTSNWEQTLGRDHDQYREDVFIVRLGRE